MILWLIEFVFKYLVLPLASVMALKELFSYLNLKRYSDQGVKTSYFPFLGFWNLLIFNYMDKRDVLKALKKERRVNKGKDMVVWNDGLTTSSFVELLSPQSVKEFFDKEVDVSIKKNLVETDMVGFFFKNGEVVKTSRATFAEIFHRDNLQKICPQLTDVVYKHCAKLRKMWKDSGKDWFCVDIRKDVFFQMFNDLSLNVMFGVDDPEDGPKNAKGETILHLNKMAFDCMIDLFLRSPTNLITMGVLDKLNLHPTKIKMNSLRAEINKLISREFEQRLTVSLIV